MNTFVITRRELSRFFISPLTYFVGAIFLFCTGLIFFFTVALHNIAALAWVFYIAAMVLLFVTPLLTMHLLSTEAQSGTLEILLTTPVHAWEVITGKFLATFLMFITMLVPSLVYLLLLVFYGNPDIPVILSGYLGLIFLGAVLISIGVLASALSSRQMGAVAVAVVLSLLFWGMGRLGTVTGDPVGYIFTYLSVQKHFTDFIHGLVTTNNIVYFFSAISGILFMATRILEARRGY